MSNEYRPGETSKQARARHEADAAQAVAEVPEFPKTMVKVTRAAVAVGGFTVEPRVVNDRDAEAVADEEGFTVFVEPPVPVGAKFPGWRYHKTQGAQVVATEAAAQKLGPGWTDTPYVKPEPVDDVEA